eukprot:jgi/Mesen1/5590/ME000281S04649
MTNWELKGCCNNQQVSFITFFGAYIFIILALWRTPVLMPFKLITIFLHELSHATACILTGGKVDGIEVNLNEGGLTRTRGGWQWVILPAGYLGSSFWGMVIVIMSATTMSATLASGLLCVALVIVLFKAKNWVLRWLCIGFLLLFALLFVLQFATLAHRVHPLRYATLFMGVMNGLFSVYDIYDDLISRRVNTSDAEVFAQSCMCPCNGTAWGVLWGIISLAFLLGSVYISLIIME